MRVWAINTERGDHNMPNPLNVKHLKKAQDYLELVWMMNGTLTQEDKRALYAARKCLYEVEMRWDEQEAAMSEEG